MNHLTIEISAPEGTSGIVRLPGLGPIQVNGKSTGLTKEVELSGGNHNLSRSLS
jgi:hypothetical protein